MIVYGSEIAKSYKEELKSKIDELILNNKRVPKLGVILVGNNQASLSYIKGKKVACHDVGFEFELSELSEDIGEDGVVEAIEMMNADDEIDGILVQLPLPKNYNEKRILEHISPFKDVDGLTSISSGKLFLGEDTFVPCTPLGIMKYLEDCKVDLEGKNVVVVGRSNLVGLPVARLLISAHATVTICHSRSQNLKDITSKADILIIAIGKDRYIKKDYVKDGAVVIDVGINRVDGHLYGDVDFEDVKEKASIITPVPKGVGPMTIAMLLHNVYKAYEEKQ